MRLDYERYQLIMKADSVKICTVFERRKSEIILHYCITKKLLLTFVVKFGRERKYDTINKAHNK